MLSFGNPGVVPKNREGENRRKAEIEEKEGRRGGGQEGKQATREGATFLSLKANKHRWRNLLLPLPTPPCLRNDPEAYTGDYVC